MTLSPILTDVIRGNEEFPDVFLEELLQDFWIALVSRELSKMVRKEVLTGKAKFGIYGDGKEVAQLALAKHFRKGDWRSGYYRDQTIILSLGLSSIEDYLAQLYADVENDKFSSGRQMVCHFGNPLIDENESWISHINQYNIASDVSCTAAQMPRGLGLAMASKKYRELAGKIDAHYFSDSGNEVVFCTIGDASTSEGVFWETMNAASVERVPMVVSVWDDGYGISVPVEYQATKSSISKSLYGLTKESEEGNGIMIFECKGWNYQELCICYDKAVAIAREKHIPVLIHVIELTQPQGHSTSGSHERYKDSQRLNWEKSVDCNTKMSDWLIELGILNEEQIEGCITDAKSFISQGRDIAWNRYQNKLQPRIEWYNQISKSIMYKYDIPTGSIDTVMSLSDILRLAYQLKRTIQLVGKEFKDLDDLIEEINTEGKKLQSNLYASNENSALNVPVIAPEYDHTSAPINGHVIINEYFDYLLGNHPEILVFGEDVGKIGGVNQGVAGLQKKYGEERVFDTGIREWTIIGTAQGMSMRGLRPIAEIQYLDYLIYGLPPLIDDVTTLRFRSNGTQINPLIIRTRGHRLEGIWHTGSPMGMIINCLRGMYLLVPRNFTQAAGMYNTLIKSHDPALVIEPLNSYRVKEKRPINIGQYNVPLGIPERLLEGKDITLVTYGSLVNIAYQACGELKKFGISVDFFDLQTLLPFDLEKHLLHSIKKTNKLLIVDEDVPGGASAYILRQILEVQGAFNYLDYPPMTLTAREHRTPYGNDGDYFTKPQLDDIFNTVYKIIKDYRPL